MEEVLRALKRIEKEYLGSGKAKVVDIRKDDVGLLNHVPIPHSPDSVVQDKWQLKVDRPT
uniref:Uncharacterized protein MANES_01G112300 n=1 Tax=Rhizophora mucronata TaxID=61149 RepID=A0A2P2LXJ0_RHIMU